MPNWCDNQLIILGNKDERSHFLDLIQLSDEEKQNEGQRYSILERLYPCPQELRDTMSGGYGIGENGEKRPEQIELERKQAHNLQKYGAKDWYDWSNNNWGTKWGDCDTYLETHEDEMTVLQFTTAWSPAIQGLEKVSEMFPALEFILTYSEGGMGFYGLCTFSNGESIDNCENMEDIEGLSDIDWNDEDAYEKSSDLVLQAKERLLSGVLDIF